MANEHWPAIKVERFDDETLEDYQSRRDEIVTIVEAFRRSRYAGAEAERMEARLIGLQDGLISPRMRAARPQPGFIPLRASEPLQA